MSRLRSLKFLPAVEGENLLETFPASYRSQRLMFFGKKAERRSTARSFRLANKELRMNFGTDPAQDTAPRVASGCDFTRRFENSDDGAMRYSGAPDRTRLPM